MSEPFTIEWRFEDIVYFALLGIEQRNAGCPADCQENPLSCNKDPDEMPRQCKVDFMDDLRNDYEIPCGDFIP
jgi:hypothetical protein